MTTTATLKIDRYGFPIQTCGRCGGSGKFSYNQMHGDVCYGCNGKGICHTRKAKGQYQAWARAIKATREVTAGKLQVGDQVAILGGSMWSPKIVGWRTVVEITSTKEECGWSKTIIAGEEVESVYYHIQIRFDDGKCDKVHDGTCYRRKGWVDPTPYIAKSF